MIKLVAALIGSIFLVGYQGAVSGFATTPPPPPSLKSQKSNETPNTLISELNKKSTALEVLKTLNNQGDANALAPYVKEGGTVVVTGGNSGIGVISVETVALAGMTVVLCARNSEAGNRMVDDMKLTNGATKNIRIQTLDLADLTSVENAVQKIVEEEGSIDLLLNNAGVMATPQRMETVQGFELQLGTNHIGHHMFTRLLLPHMNDEGRVVTVASSAHSFGTIQIKDMNYSRNDQIYTPWGAYGQSKLANVLFAKGLDDRLKGTRKNILSVSLHPGVIRTNLWQYMPRLLRPFTGLIADKTVEQGAATSMFCCLADSNVFSGGDYVVDCKVSAPNDRGQDLDGRLRNALWDETEKMIQDAGYTLPVDLI